MEVMILNWASRYNKDDFILVPRVWVSPDEKYIVIERFRDELYVAARIVTKAGDGWIAEFEECYAPRCDSIDLRGWSVDWSCMQYGFCKLRCFEMESGFDGTVHRFYFDRALYRKKRLELSSDPTR